MRTAEAADPFSLSFACVWVGLLYLTKGDVERSIPLLERSLHLFPVANAAIALTAAGALGCAYARSGRITEALPLLDQCAGGIGSEVRIVHPTLLLASMSEANLVAGRLDEATQLALRLRDLAQQRRERGRLAHAVWLLGELAGRRNPADVERSGQHYREALAVAEELGTRPLAAHCRLSLAKLHRRTGDHEKAREYLTTALAMFRDMHMRLWREQAEAELEPPPKNSP